MNFVFQMMMIIVLNLTPTEDQQRFFYGLLYQANIQLQPIHGCQWGWDHVTYNALESKVTDGSNFQCCMEGPNIIPGGCCAWCFDVDGDADVDLKDFAEYTVCMGLVYDDEMGEIPE